MEARPSCTPPSVTVWPRISTSLPSPSSVTVQDEPEHDTPFEVNEQPARGTTASVPARRPAARRVGDVGGMVASGGRAGQPVGEGGARSEEHTSELQTRQYLVC